MKKSGQLGRFGGLIVFGVAAAEVIIMSSPFAGFFYATLGIQPMQGFLSNHAATAWLNSFFLSSSAGTTSRLLEWNRELGQILIAVGLWGFFLSAAQVYGNKLLRRGVAKGFLYRISRHPQYLCLAIAGWGILVVWPRFLFLGLWVTMLFLYAGLARFEEARMRERFGADYVEFSESRASFLPGSPVRRLFEATLGRIRPRLAAWAVAYVVCLALAFGLAFALRGYTIRHLSLYSAPESEVTAVSVWPAEEEWMERVVDASLRHPRVQQALERRDGNPVFATIMPLDYRLRASFYKLSPDRGEFARMESLSWETVGHLFRAFLVPDRGHTWGNAPLFGKRTHQGSSVQVVFARAEKPYKTGLGHDEVLDLGVRTVPLVVSTVKSARGVVRRVQVPMEQNVWGPAVVMPMF